ncbi:MAG: SDR family oxidoreductase [Patescibacteria group bacterium]
MRKLTELFNLEGKKAVVTGGLGHLGLASTEALLEFGASVIVTGIQEEIQKEETREKLERLTGEFSKQKVRMKVLDFRSDGSIRNFFREVELEFQGLDILINNAMYGNSEDFDDGMRGTLSCVHQCCEAAFPLMERQKKGVIINIASIYGLVAPDMRTYEEFPQWKSPLNYGTAKAGVIQLTRYLASAWAPYGIRVNAVSPGPFSHPGRPEEFLKRLREKTMLNRIGTPEELKGMIALLASDASSYITGQNFLVDGGWTAW